jgi:CRP-like cAMP-binding protein
MRRTATIRGITNCNLYSLSRSELNYILQLYPEMAETIRKTAEERMVKDINRKKD